MEDANTTLNENINELALGPIKQISKSYNREPLCNSLSELENNTLYRSIVFYLFLSSLWTLVLTGLPAATTVGPDNYYAHHPNWYTGDDVIRILEPVGGLLINSVVLYKSDIFMKELKGESAFCVMLFLLGAAIYGQGAGFHSASAMFKSALETVMAGEDDDDLNALHYYMRTTWEHQVSHYLYAVGLVIVNIAQAQAYRNTTVPVEGTTSIDKYLLAASSVTYALLVGGVAVQFPSGTIVGFIYLFLYNFGILGGYQFYLYVYKQQHRVLEFGYLPVIQHFFVGNTIAFIFLICWIIAVGGFESRSGQ